MSEFMGLIYGRYEAKVQLSKASTNYSRSQVLSLLCRKKVSYPAEAACTV